jgi:hypothetical protein
MRYFEIINEGRDAVLYHGTGLSKIFGILKTNTLNANTQHDMKDYGKGYYGTQKLNGVSLTRSKKIAEKFGDIILEIDQIKLSQNKRIIPIDYFASGQYYASGQYDLNTETARSKNATNFVEAEDFVVASITHLPKYLIAVNIPEETYNNFLKLNSMAYFTKNPFLKVNNIFVNR